MLHFAYASNRLTKKTVLPKLFIIAALALLMNSENLYSETISVYNVTDSRGHFGDQDISVLETLDQTGSEDNWSVYLEAKPGFRKFTGVFYFSPPVAKNWKELKLSVNTMGEEYSSQIWQFQIRDFENNRWVTLGNNENAIRWVWFQQTFTINTDVENFINDSQIIMVRYLSNNNFDVSNIDYLSIELSEDFSNSGTGIWNEIDSETDTYNGIETETETETNTNTNTNTIISTVTDIESSDWWKPTPTDNISWQWQISGSLDSSLDVDMYDVDLFDTTAEQIALLKSAGKTVICYFSAGTYEGWRQDWKQHFPFISSGKYSGKLPPFAGDMADWDERWLDIRRIDLLAPIMKARMVLAKSKGCDGVEPDNMDAYTNGSETGISLKASDQLKYNRWIAKQAHLQGLSVGLKNDTDQLEDLVDDFDWALNEQCFQYNECDRYSVFTSAGKAVFGVEYSGQPDNFCSKARSMNLFWLKKNLALDVWRLSCDDY